VCYRYDLLSNLVLYVSKMGYMSKSKTFPECKMVLAACFSDTVEDVKKNPNHGKIAERK